MDYKIVGVTSRRWEPNDLIEDFKKNIAPVVDELIIYDDRGRDPEEPWCNEHERYNLYHKLAGEAGATHVLVTAPDERWSPTAGEILRRAIEKNQDMWFRLRVLEMFTPTAYRCDGEWAKRLQVRVYPWREGQKFGEWRLHNACVPDCTIEQIRTIGARIYHLKPIEEGNQALRVKLFNLVDPLGFFNQGIPYEYMDDKRGMELREIHPYDMFDPPYRKFVFTPGQVPRD